jgi:hypothetical protein
MEEYKKAILDYASGSKTKSKFYFKDLEKAVKKEFPEAKMRDVKKACTALIDEGELIYYSTGSSTMYGVKGKGITEDQ